MIKITNELKTGAFIVLAIGLLGFTMIRMGSIGVGTKGYSMKTNFHNTGGIKVHAPIRLSGVEIGELKGLEIKYGAIETVIEAELWIEGDVQLRSDSQAIISTLGLMGESYIEIIPGSSPKFLAEGMYVDSEDPVNMDKLMRQASEIAVDIQLTLEDARVFINHANDVVSVGKSKINRIINNLDLILDDTQPKMKRILTNMDGLLDVNRPKIDAIMANLEETSEYFMEFSEDIKHHPWKVLAKGKQKSPKEIKRLRMERKLRRATEVSIADVSSTLIVEKETTKSKGRGFAR
ncbi:MAG: phospholipid/cholesterol/gamma-HCH transport system substrate-binding protein [Candidatus Omnitrophota bacterium]|jgi:phospholipid/cholesterol/gamma-HCH transport system substrate-binding protein